MPFTPALDHQQDPSQYLWTRLWPHLGQDVAAVSMHIVEFLIEGEDV